MAGDFDVVLRVLPIATVLPSLFAFFLRHGPIPFVVGPLNGGLPWPTGFRQADKQEDGYSSLRSFYRLLPFAKSTYRNAAAIIAGSSHTYNELAAYREKLFLVPGRVASTLPNTLQVLSAARRAATSLNWVRWRPKFGPRLVTSPCGRPLRFCKSAGHASPSSAMRSGRPGLEQLTKSLGIEKAVSFCGMLCHGEVIQRLGAADVLVFPSVREFGGGVVFEALAMGAVPVVADFGGPGDIVNPEIGFKASLTNEDDVVSQIEKVLAKLANDPDFLEQLRQRGMRYARECLTWDWKAGIMTQILAWAVGQGPRPDFPPPKTLRLSSISRKETSNALPHASC